MFESILPYRRLVKSFAADIPTVWGERQSPEEKAEIYISKLIPDGPYPSPDFLNIVAQGRSAINTLVVANCPLVVAVAKKSKSFATPSFNFGDMIGVGILCLRRAALHFNSEGASLFTYAEKCIRREIARNVGYFAEILRVSDAKKRRCQVLPCESSGINRRKRGRGKQ